MAIDDYRMVVTYYDYSETSQKYDEHAELVVPQLLALRIYRISYTSNGPLVASTAVVAEEPHRLIQKDTIEEMIEYLKENGFVTEDAWTPVEMESQ